MSKPTGITTTPPGLRIVRQIIGKSLVVALPLSADLEVSAYSSQLEPLSAVAALPTLDRAFWMRHSYNPAHLKIGVILRCLGLRQLNNGPGKIAFQSNNATQLANAVAEAATKLPTVLEQLLDAASDYTYVPLQDEVAQIQHRFGEEIWGKTRQRTWLLQASEGTAEYQKDLAFEDAADRDVLASHLRLWILVRAFNALRNKCHARTKSAVQANSNDQTEQNPNGHNSKSLLPVQETKTPARSDASTVSGLAGDTLGEYRGKGRALNKTGRTKTSTADNDTAITSYLDEGRSKRLGKGALSAPANAASATQDHSDDSIQQELSQSKRKRNPRRNYLSKDIVRNSSDESEDDNILTPSSTPQDSELAITETNSQRTEDPYHSSTRSLSVLDTPIRKTLARLPARACKSCSERHQRCDRTHPICGRCATLGVFCAYLQISDSTSSQSVGFTASPCKKPDLFTVQSTTSAIGEHDLQGSSVTISTMPLAKRTLPLAEYWNEKDWRYFYLRHSERQITLATMQSLGLKVTSRHPIHFRFDIEHFVTLGSDINKIAKELSGEFSASQLIQFAANPNYLNDQIDDLFERHSPMWTLDADRSKLLAPGLDKNYPKDLFYEESEDQRLLWIHLHRWIFIVALRHCKEMWGPKASEMDRLPQNKATDVPKHMLKEYRLEGTYTFSEPEQPVVSSTKSTGSASSIEDDAATDPIHNPTLEKCELNLLEALGQFLVSEKGKQNGSGTSESSVAAVPDPATKRPPRRRRKRLDSAITEPEQQEILRPLKQRRTDQHQMAAEGYELSTLFMSYLGNYSEPKFDELVALKNLAHEVSVLEDYATSFHTRKGTEFATTFFVVSFPAWLVYRAEIVNIKRQFACMQTSEHDQKFHHHIAVMDRSRLATRLRQAHETFVGVGHAELRPEQVIYRALITLQNEHGHSQFAEDIRTGFQGMEHELRTLGDGMIKDGGKWILDNHVSVAGLKGLRPHAWVGRDAYRQTLGLAGLGGLYA